MKGPGLRIGLDVRRIFRCSRCGQVRKVGATVVSAVCRCTEPAVWMHLEEPKRPPAHVYVSPGPRPADADGHEPDTESGEMTAAPNLSYSEPAESPVSTTPAESEVTVTAAVTDDVSNAAITTENLAAIEDLPPKPLLSDESNDLQVVIESVEAISAAMPPAVSESSASPVSDKLTDSPVTQGKSAVTLGESAQSTAQIETNSGVASPPLPPAPT